MQFHIFNVSSSRLPRLVLKALPHKQLHVVIFPSRKNRIPASSSGWLSVLTWLPGWLSVPSIPLHAIHSAQLGSVLHSGTRLLSWAFGSHALVGGSKFCPVFTRNWLGIIGCSWRRPAETCHCKLIISSLPGDYWFPHCLSVRLIIRLSVCLSFHSVSIHSVFRIFLSRPLIDLKFGIWLCLHMIQINFDFLSRLTYFYLGYCPLQKCSFPDFSLPSFVILTWNCIKICLDIIQIKFVFVAFDLLSRELLPFAKISLSGLFFVTIQDIDLKFHIWICLDLSSQDQRLSAIPLRVRTLGFPNFS